MGKQATLNFNVIQTHNNFDCEPVTVDGRKGMSRRVDKRIAYIITVFRQTPTGFNTVQNIVDRLNRLHKGANYSFNDVYPTLRKMCSIGLVDNSSGAWVMSPNGRALYAKCEKNLRGV